MIKLSCDAHDEGHTVNVASGDGFSQGIFFRSALLLMIILTVFVTAASALQQNK